MRKNLSYCLVVSRPAHINNKLRPSLLKIAKFGVHSLHLMEGSTPNPIFNVNNFLESYIIRLALPFFNQKDRAVLANSRTFIGSLIAVLDSNNTMTKTNGDTSNMQVANYKACMANKEFSVISKGTSRMCLTSNIISSSLLYHKQIG